jgi:hypothetical protein
MIATKSCARVKLAGASDHASASECSSSFNDMFPTDGHTEKAIEKRILREKSAVSASAQGPCLRCPLRFFRGSRKLFFFT